MIPKHVEISNKFYCESGRNADNSFLNAMETTPPEPHFLQGGEVHGGIRKITVSDSNNNVLNSGL
jgi:hypothetical protein